MLDANGTVCRTARLALWAVFAALTTVSCTQDDAGGLLGAMIGCSRTTDDLRCTVTLANASDTTEEFTISNVEVFDFNSYALDDLGKRYDLDSLAISGEQILPGVRPTFLPRRGYQLTVVVTDFNPLAERVTLVLAGFDWCVFRRILNTDSGRT